MYKPKKTESKLLIYQKYVDLIEYGYKLLIKYPKYEKYALVSEIRRNMYQSLKYILYANKIANKFNRRVDKIMPKRVNNIFKENITFTKLLEAHSKCKKNKR